MGKHLICLCYKSLTANLCSQKKDESVTVSESLSDGISHPRMHCAAQCCDPKGTLGSVLILVMKLFLSRTMWDLFGKSELIQREQLGETSHLFQIVPRTRPVFCLELLLGDPSFLLSLEFVITPEYFFYICLFLGKQKCTVTQERNEVAEHNSSMCLASLTIRLVLGIFQQKHFRVKRAVFLQFLSSTFGREKDDITHFVPIILEHRITTVKITVLDLAEAHSSS